MGQSGNMGAHMTRQHSTQIDIHTSQDIPVTLFANEDVPVEAQGVRQVRAFCGLSDSLDEVTRAQRAQEVEPFWGARAEGALERIVLTPDFHKGSSGIPVGTVARTRHMVVPKAVGNDICCGMRLLVTSLRRKDLAPMQDALERELRGIFFEGKRGLALSPKQREALLRDGPQGLHRLCGEHASLGLWAYYDPQAQRDDLARMNIPGGFHTQPTGLFDDYIQGSGGAQSYGAHLGSVGGGNHFVEIQTVDAILDGATAHAWGLEVDQVVVMIHTGSIGFGHRVGKTFQEKAAAIYPKGVSKPEHDFYVLPTQGPHAPLARAYLNAMRQAANFALCNRLFLGLMVLRAMTQARSARSSDGPRRVQGRLLYDVPHNLIWADGEDAYIHRKGACPAHGPQQQTHAPFTYTGAPVLVPGSMGDASYVMAGQGNPHALCSACHGAGRAVGRGQMRRLSVDAYAQQVAPLRVVTSVNTRDPQVRARRDILAAHSARLAEEAPGAYKPIGPVVETIEQAQIARRVARLWPWMTIKS